MLRLSLRCSSSVVSTASRSSVRFYSAAQSVSKSSSELTSKLSQELKFEQEQLPAHEPDWLTEFKKSSPWKILDVPGEKEIALTRQFGSSESIKALFSIDALEERNDDLQEFEGEEETESEEDEAAFPVNLTIIVEKSVKGESDALEFTAQLSESSFYIENVAYNKSAKLMSDESAEADWIRRGKYGGPVFADLDEGVQDVFHKYLEERGFDEELANIIPQYIEFKEQNEYMKWLNEVGKFSAR